MFLGCVILAIEYVQITPAAPVGGAVIM